MKMFIPAGQQSRGSSSWFSHGAGAEPFHFLLLSFFNVVKPGGTNPSGMKAAPGDAARSPPGFRGRPFLSSPSGEFSCEKSRFCHICCSSCEPRGEFCWRVDQGSPDGNGDGVGCCISSRSECKLEPARTDPALDVGAAIPEPFRQMDSGIRSSVSVPAAGCGTEGRQ